MPHRILDFIRPLRVPRAGTWLVCLAALGALAVAPPAHYARFKSDALSCVDDSEARGVSYFCAFAVRKPGQR